MTADSFNDDRDLDRLIDRMCDQVATADDLAALGCRLTEDTSAQDRYLASLRFHAALAWQMSPGVPFSAEELERHAGGTAPVGRSRAAALAVGRLATSVNAEPFVGSFLFSYMVASVVLCAMLLGAWAYKVTVRRPISSSDVASSPATADDLPTPRFVGNITGMSDCRWTDPNDAPFAGTAVALGRRFSLSSGLLEITYNSGARVILAGPCSFEVDSETGGYLAIGKLTARINTESKELKTEGGKQATETKSNATSSNPNPQPPASLFSIRTPTAIVTDLGTEFGVEVDKRGRTTTQVFVGSVRLASVAADGAVRAEQILSAGQVGTASAVGEMAVSAPADGATAFTRMLPLSREAHKAEADAYAKLVMSLGPVAYYRMERPNDKKDILTVFDSAPGGRHGKLSVVGRAGGSERLWCRGRYGGALRLRGDFFGDYVIAPRTPDSDSNQLSVSVWVLVDVRGWWSQIVGEGGSRNNCRFKISMVESDTAFLSRVAPKHGDMEKVRFNRTEDVPLGRWYHVAVVADGATVRLFLDGVEADVRPCDGVLASPPGEHLILGCDNLAHDPKGMRLASFWGGRIDELAIFHRALSLEEIKRLYTGPDAERVK